MKPYIFLVSLVMVVIACQDQSQRSKVTRLSGETMGTTYAVTALDSDLSKSRIDSLLQDINQSVSTYISNSLISQINQSDSVFTLEGPDHLIGYFLANFELSDQIHRLTDGAFDPTVMPLVNAWGFGYKNRDRQTLPDSAVIDSLMEMVGLECFSIRQDSMKVSTIKKKKGCELDFSAVAKGFGVDEVGRLLESTGCHNYLVEIGGEVRCRGVNQNGEPWRIGVNVPHPEAQTDDIQLMTPLADMSMATSGNYRNFYMIDNQRVSHSINPQSGYPEHNEILSASILTKECARADALATSCMILGLDQARELVLNLDGVEGYFIFGGESDRYEQWSSPGFPKYEKPN